MFEICKYQLRQGFFSIRTYIALLIGIVIEIVCIMPLGEFSKIINAPLNIYDAFLYFNLNSVNAVVVFLALVVLISDIPFTSHNENYVLLRTTKKKWVMGKILYLFIMCTFFYIVLFFVGTLFTADNFSCSNDWSKPLTTLSQDTNGTLQTEYNVYFPYKYLITKYSPFETTVLSITLSIFYGFVMSLFIFLMNLLFPRVLGYAYSMILHLINYTLIFVFTSHKFIKYSLLGNNLLAYHKIDGNVIGKFALTLKQSYVLDFVIILILVFLIMKSMRKYEFKTT